MDNKGKTKYLCKVSCAPPPPPPSPACPVTAPSNPNVTNLTATSAQLNWTSGAGGTSQRLYLDESRAKVVADCASGCLISQIGLDPNLTSYATGNILEPGLAYYWKVVEYRSASCQKTFSTIPSFLTLADAWTQALNGNIHANALLSFVREAPSGQYHGQYLISSRGTIGANVSSQPGWLADLYPEGSLSAEENTPVSLPTYNQLRSLFGREATTSLLLPSAGSLVNGGVYEVTQSDVLDNIYSVPSGVRALIFVDGNLTIDAEVRVPANSFLAFIGRDNLEIGKALLGGDPSGDEIQATLIAQGFISTAYDRTGPTEVHRRLIISGNLVSLADTIFFYRNLGDGGNGTTPAELVSPRLRTFIQAKNILAKPRIFWREIPAGF